MKINKSVVVIRGLCLGFIILSIILSVGTICELARFRWSDYIVTNSLAVISIFVGLKNEARVRSLSQVEFKNEVIHAFERILHFVGWLGGGGGILCAILAVTPWLFKEHAPVVFFGGLFIALMGMFVLHVSWNLRRNFRRIIPD